MRVRPLFVLVTSLLLTTACSGGGGLGALGDILGSVGGGGAGGQQQQQQVQAEIQQVDSQNQRIHVRIQNGQTGSLRYDQQTTVVYRQQQYPVTALERGDMVNIQVMQSGQNDLYAARVDVVQSIQERNGSR